MQREFTAWSLFPVFLMFAVPSVGGLSADEPVPKGEPLLSGVRGVTNPVLIPESKVAPTYPTKARKKRIEGEVILQVLVKKDGTVGNIKVLRSPKEGLGFKEAAVKAVKQWRYKPALENGVPVDVYFTVLLKFKLSES